MSLGSGGRPIVYKSHLQSTVEDSSNVVEYISTYETAVAVVGVKNSLLEGYHIGLRVRDSYNRQAPHRHDE